MLDHGSGLILLFSSGETAEAAPSPPLCAGDAQEPFCGATQPSKRGGTKGLSGEAAARRRSRFLCSCLAVAGEDVGAAFALVVLPVLQFV